MKTEMWFAVAGAVAACAISSSGVWVWKQEQINTKEKTILELSKKATEFEGKIPVSKEDLQSALAMTDMLQDENQVLKSRLTIAGSLMELSDIAAGDSRKPLPKLAWASHQSDVFHVSEQCGAGQSIGRNDFTTNIQGKHLCPECAMKIGLGKSRR